MPLYEGIGYGREKDSVILDIGAAYTKCGFGGENGPRCIIPSEVRRPSTGRVVRLRETSTEDLHDVLVDFLYIVYFRHLLVTPTERRVVICESVLNPSANRQTLAKVLFKHYQVPSVVFCPTHLLTLFTLGASSALVMDSGYTETFVLPVYEGMPILKAWQALPLAGKALHDNLKIMLLEAATISTQREEQQPLSSVGAFVDEKVLEDIKVRCCFVTKMDRAKQIQQAKLEESGLMPTEGGAERLTPPPDVAYPLDGGRIVHVSGKIREETCEVLFEQDMEEKSLATLLLDAILKCPIDIRKTLAENLVIVGGTSMLPGFKARLKAEIYDLLDKPQYKDCLKLKEVKFHQPPAKDNYTAWLGGAIFGALEVLPSRSVSREKYLQTGVIPDWSSLSGDEAEEGESSPLKSR